MLRSISHKRGDTFSQVFTYAPGDVPTSLVGATVRSELRALNFVQALTVTAAPDQVATPGKMTLSCEYASTALWPIGELRGDIEVTLAGVRASTDDFIVKVREDQTH